MALIRNSPEAATGCGPYKKVFLKMSQYSR